MGDERTGEFKSTVPNLKGDLKYSERGPKGDPILSKRGPKGDQKGTKKGPKTQVVQKIEKRLHVEIFQKLNLDGKKKYVCFLLTYKQTDISLTTFS